MSEKLKNIVLICLTALFLGGFAVWGIIKPDEAQSQSERRKLASFPTVSGETLLSGDFMSAFEEYSLDQFPLRDDFRTLKALTALYAFGQRDNNGIYIENGFVSKLDYPLDDGAVQYAASRFEYVYERYLAQSGAAVYLSVIPDKNYFMAQQNGYPCADYNALVSELRDDCGFAEYIDISQLLELSDYYRTDAHWRQDKILDAASYLAAQMGVTLTERYTENLADEPFYGVYYGQSALPLEPDELYYLTSPVLDGCRVYDYEKGAYISVYDLDAAAGDDAYEMFLSGSKSLLTIENPAASTDRELIIFRDSFGSSIAPLLAEGYSRITLVDIRYISPALLDGFISFDGQDVLFLYSSSVLNNSVTIK